MEPGQHPLHIGEHVPVPLKAAPLVLPHPEAVEVEHPQGDVPLPHAVHEAHDGLLVVAGGKGGAEPQPEGPGGGQGRAARQGGIPFQHALAVRRAYEHEIQALAGHAELDLRHRLGAHLKGHRPGVVHQHAVAVAAQVKGDVLIGNLAGGTPVLVPDVHGLAVSHKGGEPLSQAIDLLSHVHLELAAHEGPLRRLHETQHGGAEPLPHASELPLPVVICKGAGPLADDQPQQPGGYLQLIAILPHREGAAPVCQVEPGHFAPDALEVHCAQPQHIRLGGGDGYLLGRAVQAPIVVSIGHREQMHLPPVPAQADLAYLLAVVCLHPRTHEPFAVVEFHGKLLLSVLYTGWRQAPVRKNTLYAARQTPPCSPPRRTAPAPRR